MNTINDACRKIVGRPLLGFYDEVETRSIEELITELTILREQPATFPKPELKEVDIPDFPVSYDPELNVSDVFLRNEIEKFVQSLEGALAKPRIADGLANFDKLKELHGIAYSLSGKRQVPNVDVEGYLKAMKQYDLKKQNPKLELRGLEFWEQADLFASMRAGNKYNSLSFSPEYGRLEIEEIPLVLTREFIRVRRMAIPVDGSEMAEESLSFSLKHLIDSFNDAMDGASQKTVATYASNVGFATARHNFNYIGIDQRWFHEGFAGYVSWAVMKHILGDAENKVYWDTVSSFGKVRKVKIPIEAFVSYDAEAASPAQLRGAGQRLFLSIHANIGREAIDRWFDSLDANRVEVEKGNITVLSLLEEVLGQSILSVE